MIAVESFLSSFVDRAIAIASPRAALARRMYRDRLSKTGGRRAEMYAAAKTSRLNGSAFSILGGSNVNDIIGASSPILRSRVRQLLRDFPYLARAANVMVDYSVGTGITFQSKVKTPRGKLDKTSIGRIEDAMKWWMDEADASGKLHYYEIMRLAKRQDLEAGEFLIVKTFPKDRDRFLPYALQIYESDWLTSSHDSYGSGGVGVGETGRETRQGIEYEKATGRVTGYWFRDPNYGGEKTYVGAWQVLHGFQTLRPQQLRGVSPYAPGILIADSLNDYLEAEIDGAKMAAKYLAFVTTSDPAARQDMAATQQVNDDGTVTKIEEMENAIIEYLRDGEDITLSSPNRPGTTFQPFVRLILTMLSIVTGAPYELISGDYRGLNFSTARIVRNDFSQQLRPVAWRHVRQFGIPSIRPAIEAAVMTGKLILPGYWTNPRRYLESEWQPPGMDAIDPLREAKSQIESISYGLKSPQEVARERGKDLEEIYMEIKAAKELASTMGLKFEAAGKPQKNNPAAIIEEG